MSRLPGRPREFDTDAAIDSALLVFRERGYHATSIKELSDATGLTAGSLYKAFGSKNGLFLAAFDRYTRTRSACASVPRRHAAGEIKSRRCYVSTPRAATVQRAYAAVWWSPARPSWRF